MSLLRAAPRLAAVIVAGAIALGGCADSSGGGGGGEVHRPLGFGDDVFATKNPRVVLVPLDEGAHNPGEPCWVDYVLDAKLTTPDTITITMTQGGPTPALPASASCAGPAVAGIYQRIHLPVAYHGRTILDAADGHRVRVLHLSTQQQRQMHPPVG